jgi:hypothetical protein
MSPRTFPCLLLSALALTTLVAATGPRAAAREVRWKKTVLDTAFRAEGAAAADVNRDGKIDILAGAFWYEAPNWTPHEIRPPQAFDGATGYSDSFFTFAYDIDKDRWPDQIIVGFPGAESYWMRNPGLTKMGWVKHTITDSACNESPQLVDIDGDGEPELVSPYKESQMAYYDLGTESKQVLVGEPGKPGNARFAHGLGIADINGDKLPDILIKDGYYEHPKSAGAGLWKFVPAKLGPECAHMYTEDFDGDGDLDVISSSAHQSGVWWHEQRQGKDGPEFVQHLIDNTISQTHAMAKADINGDGRMDYVTGKRWWAHGPAGDVNPMYPAILVWYEWKRIGDEVHWTRHDIDYASGVGTQCTVADVNKDKRPDVIIANKRGVFLLEQVK